MHKENGRLFIVNEHWHGPYFYSLNRDDQSAIEISWKQLLKYYEYIGEL